MAHEPLHDPEGLLAASLYEPLSPDEQAFLEEALAASEPLRNDQANLLQLLSDLEGTVPPLDIDLLPGIRARLSQSETQPMPWAWRRLRYPAMAAAAAVLLTVSLWNLRTVDAPVETPATMLAANAATPLGAIVQAVEPVLARREYGNAVRALREGLNAHPGDAEAGTATLMLADLEYSQLQRYDEAYNVYENLRTQYPAVFSAHPEAIQRFDVLSESRNDGFSPLYALNAAGDSFDALERVVAQYPNKLVGTLAMNTMQRLECADSAAEPASAIAALESVRDRCTHPVALAQVNLNLGELYWNAQHNPAKAREAFLAVTASGHADSAQLAKQALAQLDNSPVR